MLSTLSLYLRLSIYLTAVVDFEFLSVYACRTVQELLKDTVHSTMCAVNLDSFRLNTQFSWASFHVSLQYLSSKSSPIVLTMVS